MFYYSLEMSRNQLVERLISYLVKIDNQTIRHGHEDLGRNTIHVKAAAADCNKVELYLLDDRGHDIRHYFHDVKHYRPDFVFLDYIQLVSKLEFEKTHESIGQVLAYFKRLSKVYNCGVVIMSQLNREMMLKGSGSLEEVADAIVELDWTGKESDDPGEQPDYIANVSKQRHGPTRVVHLAYRAECFEFKDK